MDVDLAVRMASEIADKMLIERKKRVPWHERLNST